MSQTPQQFDGEKAEQLARSFLQQQGLHFITRNFRCKLGEIDLIMRDQQQLVFVEVRFRRNQRYGGAAASVTWHKQQKLRRAAQVYLQQQALAAACRFDVLCVGADTTGQMYCDNWIKNAF